MIARIETLEVILFIKNILFSVSVSQMAAWRNVPRAREQRDNSAVRWDKSENYERVGNV